MTECPVCEKLSERPIPNTGDLEIVDCVACGLFRINGTSKQVLSSLPLEQRQAALAAARERAQPGAIPYIMNV